MKQTNRTNRRMIAQGIAVSFVALIVVSVALLAATQLMPSTPLAKILNLIRINPNNPAVYFTSLFRAEAPSAENQDALVETPIAMFAAGLVFGIFARRAGQKPGRAAITGAVTAVAMDILVQAFPWIANKIESSQGGPPMSAAVSFAVSPTTLAVPACEVALSAAAYALGAWIVGVVRRKGSQGAESAASEPVVSRA